MNNQDYRLTEEQRARFHRDGFLVVPNVLSRDQVQELRQFCARIFDAGRQHPGDDEVSRADVFCRFPEVRWLLVHPPVLGALKSLLGDDFVYLHEWGCHDSFFGGWHKDTTSQERAGQRFHYDDDYLQVEAAFYLQENGVYGGGLDVIKGSHLDPSDRFLARRRTFWTRVTDRLRRYHLWPAEKDLGYSVPSKAGDMVLFHFRTCHKATWPRVKPVPPEHRKLAMFLATSRNNRHAEAFVHWTRANGDRPHLKNHAFPPELVSLADEHGFNLV